MQEMIFGKIWEKSRRENKPTEIEKSFYRKGNACESSFLLCYYADALFGDECSYFAISFRRDSIKKSIKALSEFSSE